MKLHSEYQYLDLLKDILKNGVKKEVYGSKTYIKSVFGRQIRFNLSYGFPLLTTKKVYLRAIIYELLWFLRGDSNIKYLVDNNVHIWDEWGYKKYKDQISKIKYQKVLTQEEYVHKIKEDKKFAAKWGDLGNVYGVQWRKWKTSDGRKIDQLGWVIEKLKKSSHRKHILVSAWNPEFIYEMALPGKSMALPPCHTMFQFNTYGKKLSLQLYQRSADLFLGVPFNIASYSLLLMMVAQICDLVPHEFILTFGDVHIYSNHFDQVNEQLERKPKSLPKMVLNPKIKRIDDFKFEDFTLTNYNPHPPIKGEVTVVGGF